MPHALVAWHDNPTDSKRHALLVVILSRLGLLIAIVFALGPLLVRERAAA